MSLEIPAETSAIAGPISVAYMEGLSTSGPAIGLIPIVVKIVARKSLIVTQIPHRSVFTRTFKS